MSEKPTPPADLWEQLAQLHSMKEPRPRPAESFTTTEYAEKFGISQSQALRRIRKLMGKGLVRRGGTTNNRWYVLTSPEPTVDAPAPESKTPRPKSRRRSGAR